VVSRSVHCTQLELQSFPAFPSGSKSPRQFRILLAIAIQAACCLYSDRFLVLRKGYVACLEAEIVVQKRDTKATDVAPEAKAPKAAPSESEVENVEVAATGNKTV
jgi:hypothetical protein